MVKTIKSAIDNASNPENLRFAIYNQEDLKIIDDLKDYRRDSRFNITDIHWKEATGLGPARTATDKMYDGETFTMQIDSHMRFAPMWDKILKWEWETHGGNKAVLSEYPPAWVYDLSGVERFQKREYPTRIVVNGQVEDAVTTLDKYDVKVPTDVPHLLVCGNFWFAPGNVNLEVPTDPRVSYGDELIHSLRLFQNGYNVYTPNDLPIWHWYGRTGKANRISTDFTNDLKAKLDKVTELTRNSCNEIVFGPDPVAAKRPTRIFMKKLKLAYMDMPWPDDWPDPDNWDVEAAELWAKL